MDDDEHTLELDNIDQQFEGVGETFIDGAGGIVGRDGVIKINLFVDRLASPSAKSKLLIKRFVTNRLVMTDETFFAMADWFADQAKQLKDFKNSHSSIDGDKDGG